MLHWILTSRLIRKIKNVLTSTSSVIASVKYCTYIRYINLLFSLMTNVCHVCTWMQVSLSNCLTFTLFHIMVLISQIQLSLLPSPPTTKRWLSRFDCVKEVAAWDDLGPGISGPRWASFCQCCRRNMYCMHLARFCYYEKAKQGHTQSSPSHYHLHNCFNGKNTLTFYTISQLTITTNYHAHTTLSLPTVAK